jgi:putative hemolysin
VKPTDWLLVAIAVVLIILSAFLAMAETAMTRMGRVRARSLADEGKRGGAILHRLMKHPERFLNPVLFLLLVCNLVAATLIGVIADDVFGPWGVVVATLFEVLVIFVFAEAAPKTWAVQHPDRAALFSAPFVSAIVSFPPLRWLTRGLIGLSNALLPGKGLKEGPFVSEKELLAMADVAVEEDVIEHEEREIIQSLIDFGDTVVREVMVPRPDMVAVEARAKVSDVIEVAIAAGYSRIPVFEQGIDDIVGIIYVKDLMRSEREGVTDIEVRQILRPAQFVPETKRVHELMREMQRDKFHMAIVVDEYGGTAGLVTLEDLIEELVGEIVDEFDVEEPQSERTPTGDLRVNARMPVDEVNELVGADLPEGDWDTVGGLVYSLLGHVPNEGESVEVDGHRLVAEKVQGRRIGRVRISRLTEPAGADG